MNILVLGAAGNVGRRTVMEALSRGHTVTASGRNRTRLEGFPPGVDVQELNITDPAAVTKLVDGQDVVVNATRPPASNPRRLRPSKTRPTGARRVNLGYKERIETLQPTRTLKRTLHEQGQSRRQPDRTEW